MLQRVRNALMAENPLTRMHQICFTQPKFITPYGSFAMSGTPQICSCIIRLRLHCRITIPQRCLYIVCEVDGLCNIVRSTIPWWWNIFSWLRFQHRSMQHETDGTHTSSDNL